MSILRGIVIKPIDGFISQGFMALQPAYTALEWRYMLLYWDKIAIPQLHIGYAQIGGADEELLSTGCVNEYPVRFAFSGNPLVDRDPVQLATKALHQLIAKNQPNEEWCMHQFGTDFDWGNVEVNDQIALRMRLMNCLPAPTEDIPLHEVLDFKGNRRDEFNALHDEVDALYESILDAPDKVFKEKKVLGDLENSIRNVNRVTKERFKDKTSHLTISVTFSLQRIIAGLAVGAYLEQGLSVEQKVIAGALGVAACSIDLKVETTKSDMPNGRIIHYLSKAEEWGVNFSH